MLAVLMPCTCQLGGLDTRGKPAGVDGCHPPHTIFTRNTQPFLRSTDSSFTTEGMSSNKPLG